MEEEAGFRRGLMGIGVYQNGPPTNPGFLKTVCLLNKAASRQCVRPIIRYSQVDMLASHSSTWAHCMPYRTDRPITMCLRMAWAGRVGGGGTLVCQKDGPSSHN